MGYIYTIYTTYGVQRIVLQDVTCDNDEQHITLYNILEHSSPRTTTLWPIGSI